ncbi:hypothetical protein OTU49_011241 [Cherax quadricarinatus]|uniref:Uncharacterized protein n=1 Tax=Cherax quadricarinatus TaxID=27406 RepID=A0AAW0W4M7_CHEQU|nr:uncharacterized protein LOC128703055 [Cherax quadricarinatus]
MRVVVVIGVVVLATLPLCKAVKNDEAETLSEDKERDNRCLFGLPPAYGIRIFCYRIKNWIDTTGAAILVGSNSSNVTALTSSQVIVLFFKSLCSSTRIQDVQRRNWNFFGLTFNPINDVCNRVYSFLTTTGSAIMQGASTNATLLTPGQVLVSAFRAVCNTSRNQ